MTASKFTQPIKDGLIKAIKAGAFYEHACNAVGISYQCLWEWNKYAEECIAKNEQNEYTEFFYAIKKAEQENIDKLVGLLTSAADDHKQWTAGAWLLERRHRKQYGRDAEVADKLEKMLLELADKVEKMIKAKEIGGFEDGGEMDSESNKK